MKFLTSTLLIASFAFGANAAEVGDVKQVTSALLKQQNSAVSQAVANQVKYDIQMVLRAMQLPKVDLDQAMLAKADKKTTQSTRSE
ncbi:hypothetical protein [Colwellia sp. MEBiC06753]